MKTSAFLGRLSDSRVGLALGGRTRFLRSLNVCVFAAALAGVNGPGLAGQSTQPAAGKSAGKLALGNDNFGQRTELTGLPLRIMADNTDVTKEPGEPDHGGNSGGHSLWWSWTAPAAGQFNVTTAGSSFDTLLGVYTGPLVSELTTIDTQDRGQTNENITFHALAGTEYAIAVDGYLGATGTVSLNLTFVPSPVNDDFANRTVLTGPAIDLVATNVAATKEPGEPDHVGKTGGKSVWWSWTPTAEGPVRISTLGSSLDTLLAVYTGADVTNLVAVAANDSTLGDTVSFRASAGTAYQIAVDGYNGEEGQFPLQLRQSVSIPLAASSFNQDGEMWTVVSLPDQGPYTNVVGGPYFPSYVSTNGNPGGYLSQSDPDGNTWYWEAPQKHLGDQSAAYGGALSFDLCQSGLDSQYDAADVVVIGAGLTLVFDTEPNPGTNWTSYHVPLVETAGWKKDSLSGVAPTQAEFLAALRAVSALRIRGEFRVGADVGGLDNVALTAAVAAPSLAIQLVSSTQLTVSWPAAFGGFRLETKGDLTSTNGWSAVTKRVATNAGAFTVIDPLSGAQKFYRLRQP